ncbi:4-hydroxyphenylacetate 3-monooxygenase, oxygenase component [Bacillus niameyensis]|uniref:4-hydroxyphenylacetate 3-monooxygenase, oxygenase component n=1 Tax=Bacillus niameyensis TaxID=1522308 RepID=UPI00078134D2|nr:4-hydroxyphenylacetate 3-monooxygenase, oxygenase component [Bacillus niameyensis]
MTISGKEYIDRINQLKSEIWVDGKKITGKVSEHPAFHGVMKSKAQLLDMQNDPALKDIFTFTSPNREEKVSFSFHHPKTKEDLLFRKEATEKWARCNFGLLGRSPDYVNTGIMILAASEKLFGVKDQKFGDNIRNTYENAMKNDLTFTHTFINPQVNRSIAYFEDSQENIAARIIDENSDGIIIDGARLLATQGGITDEILVLPAGSNFNEKSYVYGFTVPSNTPGLKFICRESFTYDKSDFNHPLSSRFEEMDSIVVFDHVLIPWEKVFLYKDLDIARQFFAQAQFNTMLLYQAVIRMIVKTEFILGLAESIVEAINIREYQHIQDKVSEIIAALEIMKALHMSSRVQASLDSSGTMIPDARPLHVAIHYYPKVYPRLVEILQLLGGSGLILLPTEKSFESTIRPYLEKYLQGTNSSAEDRVMLFRLTWDLCMSAFGSRQTHYERFFFGDPVRLAMGLYNGYPKKEYTKAIEEFLNTVKD